MSLTPTPAMLWIALLATVAGEVEAQAALPQRARAEDLSAGLRKVQRDRVIVLGAGATRISAVGGDALLDLFQLEGELPLVFGSAGGALFQDMERQLLAPAHWLLAAGTEAPALLLLQSVSAQEARLSVLSRREPVRGHENPWRVPVPLIDSGEGSGPGVTRQRPGFRDRVSALGSAEPIRLNVRGLPALRLELWRAQVATQLPPDATWLRVQVDGRDLFNAPVPPAFGRERLYETGDCVEVLDAAGRLHLSLPEGSRELTIHGEPGVWLKALSALPGSPDAQLRPQSDPAQESLLPRPGESDESRFDRAVNRLPEPRTQRYLGRHAYYRPVAIAASATLVSRRWRVRFPLPGIKRNAISNAPEPGQDAVAKSTFHWLAVGASWRITVPGEDHLGLLRISAAHEVGGPVQIQLTQAGRRDRQLRLDPRVIETLRSASATADPLLALQQGAAVIDASAALIKDFDTGQDLTLTNTGQHGAWIAIEQRIPAPVRLAAAAETLAAGEGGAALRKALLMTDAEAVNHPLAATRAIEEARRLLAARERAFRADRCFAVAQSSSAAARALGIYRAVESTDPVLARCALLQAASAGGASASGWEDFDAWTRRHHRADLRTGFAVWLVVQDPAQSISWQRLAYALRAESQDDAARLVQLTSDPAQSIAAEPGNAEVEPDISGGQVRLRTERQRQLSYGAARDMQIVQWTLPGAGDYELELRSAQSGSGPQWIEITSGDKRWITAVPPATNAGTLLRDIVTGNAPGPAVRIAFNAAGSQGVSVRSLGSSLLARLVGRTPEQATAQSIATAGSRALDVTVASACVARTARLVIAVPVTHPVLAQPEATLAPLVLASEAPALAVDKDLRALLDRPADADQAALLALRLMDSAPIAAASAAGWALYRRDLQADTASGELFALLESRLEWRTTAPLGTPARRIRQLADGRSGHPLHAQRQQLAGPASDDELLLRAGQRWVLDGLQPGQAVTVRVRRLSTLPTSRISLEIAQAAPRIIESDDPVDLSVRANSVGELRISVGEALPGSMIAMRLFDSDQQLIDARRPVAHFRATPTAPLRLRVTEPTYLRVTEWNGGDSAITTTRWVPKAGDTPIFPTGRSEQWLRVSAPSIRPQSLSEPDLDPVRDQPVPSSVDPGSTEQPDDARGKLTAPYVPAAGQASSWPDAWPTDDGLVGTWGVVLGAQLRRDADDSDDSHQERSADVRWRLRYRPAAQLWARFDVIGRWNPEGFAVAGLEHSLQWRQADGPWGGDLNLESWRQSAKSGSPGISSSTSAEAVLHWQQRRHERWEDRVALGLLWRNVDSDARLLPSARLDNDVYTRYKDRHRNQLSLAYELGFRARYNSEWTGSLYARSNPFSQFSLDHAGAGLDWRWTRQGWQAGAGLDLRTYVADADRVRLVRRQRLQVDLGRTWLTYGQGWRLRANMGYELSARTAFGALTVEWFSHDGRGLGDFLPSELALRGVLQTDLHAPLTSTDSLEPLN